MPISMNHQCNQRGLDWGYHGCRAGPGYNLANPMSASPGRTKSYLVPLYPIPCLNKNALFHPRVGGTQALVHAKYCLKGRLGMQYILLSTGSKP